MVLVQAIGVGGGVVVSIARLWRRRRNGSSISTRLLKYTSIFIALL
jgi:hypothetical protein